MVRLPRLRSAPRRRRVRLASFVRQPRPIRSSGWVAVLLVRQFALIFGFHRMALVLTAAPFVPWPRCHHEAGFQHFIYVLGAPTPGLSRFGSPARLLVPIHAPPKPGARRVREGSSVRACLTFRSTRTPPQAAGSFLPGNSIQPLHLAFQLRRGRLASFVRSLLR